MTELKVEKVVEEGKKKAEPKPRISTEFKIVGVFSNDEFVASATSDASLKSKMVHLGDKDIKNHEVVEMLPVIGEAIIKPIPSQNKEIKKLTNKTNILVASISKEEDEEKAEKLQEELNEIEEILVELEELQTKLTSTNFGGMLYVLHKLEEDGSVGDVFTTTKKVKAKDGKRNKLNYFVYETFKKGMYGFNLKARTESVCLVPYSE